MPGSRAGATGRALLEGKTIHIPDVLTDPEYTFAKRKRRRLRTMLGVPAVARRKSDRRDRR